MTKKCTHIILTFENCDALEIPLKHIIACHISKISKNVGITNQSSWDYFGCDSAYLELTYGALLKETGFGFDVKEHLVGFHDVTAITLSYDDKTSECFYVPWNHESEMTNSFEIDTFAKDRIIVNIERK